VYREDQTYTAMAKQLVYRLRWHYLERENYHARLFIKKVYQPILKELEEYGVVLKTVHDLLWLCQTTLSRY
jgi:hypothetical protein